MPVFKLALAILLCAGMMMLAIAGCSDSAQEEKGSASAENYEPTQPQLDVCTLFVAGMQQRGVDITCTITGPDALLADFSELSAKQSKAEAYESRKLLNTDQKIRGLFLDAGIHTVRLKHRKATLILHL